VAAASAPVRAQEEVAAPPPAEEASSSYATSSRKKRSSRPKVAREQKKEEQKEEGGGVSLSLPSFSVPEQPKEVKKVIISPADELDDDEKSLGGYNPTALIVCFFGPSAIYLVFYVLGSLDVI